MKTAMKGIMGLAITAVMLVPVHAEADTGTKEASMPITYDKTTEYELKIPATLEVDSISEKTKEIGVASLNTRPDEKVQIKIKQGVDNTGKVTLTRTGGSSVVTTETTVSLTSNGSGIGANEIIAEFQDRSTTATKGGTLYFSAISADALAGEYKGEIVFEAAVVART